MKIAVKDLKDPCKVAEMLNEYQLWRRGVGKYAWHEDPAKNEPEPFTPPELSRIEDAAIELLQKFGSAKAVVK